VKREEKISRQAREERQERQGCECMNENSIAAIIVDTSVRIHAELGPGLLENAYESVLAFELGKQGLSVERQVPIPLVWRGMMIEDSFRADIIINKKVIIEVKSIEKVNPVHKKQVLTYLRLTGMKLGLLLNFGEVLMKNGIFRVVNGLEE